ncbi:Hypothetical Protein FCC1311_076582 [Hondaea fermentalgiana]|uniref:Uncharacterized protein n=1 Tax=Hondaea fermentalgiana TaxID=2315210 RepID=A0A2R5GU65_9STRA|nr:Hypothetical Protein FCC1311_076582 [Hondaea fermentalgiana]|eukprot:GBG31434.1 Hypothetical Protein FCC1311_076582 [Hondaea fermentalgiana]
MQVVARGQVAQRLAPRCRIRRPQQAGLYSGPGNYNTRTISPLVKLASDRDRQGDDMQARRLELAQRLLNPPRAQPAVHQQQKRGLFNFLTDVAPPSWLPWVSSKAYVKNTNEVSDDEHNSRVFAMKVGFCCATSGALPFILSATSGTIVDMGCGIAALVTVIVVSDHTVGGVLANGVYRVRATVAGATLALLGSEIVKAIPMANEPLVTVAMFAGTIPIFYLAQRWPDLKPVMILLGLTFNLSIIDMVMATHAGPMLILQRLAGVILGLGVALPVHIGFMPHYSATHALHLTEKNADLVASFTWRAIRAFERDRRAEYNTFLASESALGRGETTSVHDCFAKILLSRAELETQIKNAHWETRVSGLTTDDLDRIDAIQTGLRRAAAIGVNMDMQVAGEFSQGAQLGALVHTEALRLVERNIVRALRCIRPLLSGPVEDADLEALTNARAGLSVANQSLEREKIRILTQLVRDRNEPETCMRAVHFCSLLQDLATEVQLILRHPDFAPRDAPRVQVWRHVRELRA